VSHDQWRRQKQKLARKEDLLSCDFVVANGGWDLRIKNWKAALQQFAILYEDRLPLEAPGVTEA
jgi:hypothetical protein